MGRLRGELMTTKKEEAKQKNILSKGAMVLLGMAIVVAYLFFGYEMIYINAYPALLKGYYFYSGMMITIFIVVTVVIATLASTILSSKTYKTLLREVT
jgi:hypothetical protein